MGIRTQEKVFNKICELKGWKFHRYSQDDFYLCTNIEAPRHDNPYTVYVLVNFTHWCSGDNSIKFEFSCKPCERSSCTYHIGGKSPLWKVPKACDFNDINKAKEYAEMLEDYFAKKSTTVNKKEKQKKLDFVAQRAEYFDFYEKMNALAKQFNASFNESAFHLRNWEFSGVEIDWYYEPSKDLTKSGWRVRIPSLNYCYFRCKTLDEVYDLCKWYAEIPNMPVYKF